MRTTKNLKNKLILSASTSSLISQAYSSIASRIILERQSPEQNLFLVTSASCKDGRSLTAINLAISLANRGKRVLIVDGDLRDPAVHIALDVDIKYTFSDIILQNLDSSKAIVKSFYSHLDILPSQKSDVDPLVVLSSPRVGKLFEKLKSTYDFIIIDSPPLLQFTDALILASLVDKILLVLDRMKSKRAGVREVIDKIEKNKDKIIGVVVNAEFNPIPRSLRRII